MNAAWVLVVAPVLAALDAATGRHASRLWRGIPESVDRRLANRCDLGNTDD